MQARAIDPATRDRAIESVEALPGWLLEGDALKLYELAHSADGPILEIGTYRGKSTIIMASALRDAGRGGPIVSLDVDAIGLEEAAAAARARGVADRIALVRGTVAALLRSHPGFAPTLVFLDGDHSRRGVARDLAALRDRVPRGALLLFHDFHDDRNADPAQPDYGVPQAIEASWVASDCELVGVFGCCGLFERLRGPQLSGAINLEPGAEIADLGREPIRSWIDRRIVGAVSRRLST